MAKNASVERFKKLTDELKKECLTVARAEIATQADRLVRVMKSVVPVNADPPPKPGLLRDSIGWTFGTPPKTRATGAFRPKNPSEFAANVYAGSTEAFYARWVEFGTQAHSLSRGADVSRQGRGATLLGSGGQHPGSVAQPFFWPSYRLLKKSMRSATKRALSKAIKERSAK